MATFATSLILDLIAASGPQSLNGCKREVRTQVTAAWEIDHPSTATELAVNALCDCGLIEYDDIDQSYDLSEFGWDCMMYEHKR